jgi:energy-coupling factor transport system ATP-binding protein
VIADGEVVTDGTAAEVLTASAMFAPMTAKVLAPAQWLTVDEIRHAIAEN